MTRIDLLAMIATFLLALVTFQLTGCVPSMAPNAAQQTRQDNADWQRRRDDAMARQWESWQK